jgi:hypothetical protein
MMGRAYSWDDEDKECVQNFCGETSWEIVHLGDRKGDESIRMDVRKTVCEDGKWMELAQDRTL